MNKYETIFIMKDDITEEQKNAVIDKIKTYISTNGKITKTENIGLKKLAYEIQKYKQGYYYIINFESKSDTICELERTYRITDEIIKFITVKQN